MNDLRRAGLALVFAATASSAVALPHDDRNSAAYACAEALSEHLAQRSFELLRLAEHPGRGNYSFWLNGADGDAAGYCETRRGAVSRLSLRDAAWTRTDARVPEVPLVGAID